MYVGRLETKQAPLRRTSSVELGQGYQSWQTAGKNATIQKAQEKELNICSEPRIHAPTHTHAKGGRRRRQGNAESTRLVRCTLRVTMGLAPMEPWSHGEPWRGGWRVERWISRPVVSGTGPIMDGHLLVTAHRCGRWWHLMLHGCIRENAIAASGPPFCWRPCHTVQASPTQLGGWVQVHGRRTAAQHPPQHASCGGRSERGGAQPQRRDVGGKSKRRPNSSGRRYQLPECRYWWPAKAQIKCDGWLAASQLTTLCKRGGRS
jgi:hypothetical protein